MYHFDASRLGSGEEFRRRLYCQHIDEKGKKYEGRLNVTSERVVFELPSALPRHPALDLPWSRIRSFRVGRRRWRRWVLDVRTWRGADFRFEVRRADAEELAAIAETFKPVTPPRPPLPFREGDGLVFSFFGEFDSGGGWERGTVYLMTSKIAFVPDDHGDSEYHALETVVAAKFGLLSRGRLVFTADDTNGRSHVRVRGPREELARLARILNDPLNIRLVPARMWDGRGWVANEKTGQSLAHQP